MLSTIQKKVLCNWLDLLKKFQQLISQSPIDVAKIKNSWLKIENYLKTQIISLDIAVFSPENQSSWQTWQTETNRYVRLLNTELLFWYTAKKEQTRNDRFQNINNRLQQMTALTQQLTE